MIKRLSIYYREMFPIIPRLLLGVIVFLEIHFLILLNYGVDHFDLGIQELVCIYTIFAFYMWLRIADDFKDYEHDKRLFADRPLPSGRVKKKDLLISCWFFQIVAIVLNLLYMNNLVFFVILYGYGYLMSRWFFHKHKIQTNLILAIITHNPVQIFVNLYVISFTLIKYQLKYNTWVVLLVMFTLYFPSLIWEVSRKIRAPKDETEYTTYSKIFGYKKAALFVAVITIIDILTNIALVHQINAYFIILLILLVSGMTLQFKRFIDDPTRFKLVKHVEIYTYIQESLMILAIGIYIIFGKR